MTTRRGGAMVELAIVLSMFLLIVLGIAEFGRALMVNQAMTSAAREGARLGATVEDLGTMVARVQARTQERLRSAGILDGTVEVQTPAGQNGNVTVIVRVPFSVMTVDEWFPQLNVTFTRMCVMRHEPGSA